MKQKSKQNLKQSDNKNFATKKEQKSKNKKKRPILKMFIFVFIIVMICTIEFLVYKFYTFQKLTKEMFNNTPSKIYDASQNVIGQIGAERNRDNIKLSSIPQNLVNAYISIEDKRYYSHFGVDIRSTGSAILSYISRKGNANFGGSTITQQLVKNLTGDDSNSIKRKIKEWGYACVLNAYFSKDEILEAYFNIIYTGPNIYGVKTAAKYYFSKEISDLTLAECAYIAGINNAPNSYNPFTDNDRTEKISKRTKKVLTSMLNLNHISQEEYDAAIIEVDNGLNFKKGDVKTNNLSINSYHTDALINEVILDFSKKKHISKDFAENYFCLSGSNIYSTVNNEIQTILEKESKDSKYIIKSLNTSSTSQAAIVVLDNETGYVVGLIGGLGEKSNSRSFNRATQMKRQTGSSMKPIAVLLPALAEKQVTNVTLIEDTPSTFIDYKGNLYSPTDYDPYKGTITLRQAVESSQNIPFVKIMEKLTPQTSIKYLEKMGISSLNDNDVNLSLALGGLDEGISPLEFAGAYFVIANNRNIYRTYFLFYYNIF